jgi:hypothetical protein
MYTNLLVLLSEPRRLLLAEEDGRVFALILGALTAVSVVCARAADCAPRYTAALRAGSTSMVAMETVTSSDRPGEVSVEKLPCVLTVPPTSLLDGADGASKEVSL